LKLLLLLASRAGALAARLGSAAGALAVLGRCSPQLPTLGICSIFDAAICDDSEQCRRPSSGVAGARLMRGTDDQRGVARDRGAGRSVLAL
jgi:hypothetical protein